MGSSRSGRRVPGQPGSSRLVVLTLPAGLLTVPLATPAEAVTDLALGSRCTGTAPITCHFDLQPGDYDVTVVLGDAATPGVTGVQAKARRTVLPAVSTTACSYARYSFTLNARQPEGQPTGQAAVDRVGQQFPQYSSRACRWPTTATVRRLFAADGTPASTALHVNGVGANLPATMRQVAATQNAPLIDLTAASEALVEGLGPNASAALYLRPHYDNTHFSAHGATEMTGLVLQRMRELNLSPVPYRDDHWSPSCSYGEACPPPSR